MQREQAATVDPITAMTAMAEGNREILKTLPSPYLRMTESILAELAFQQAGLMASRLPASRSKAFWIQLGKYVADMQSEVTITR